MSKTRKLLASVWRGVAGVGHSALMVAGQPVRLTEFARRVPARGRLFELRLGSERFYLCPDIRIGRHPTGAVEDYLFFNPERYFAGNEPFFRLAPGATVNFDARVETHRALFAASNAPRGYRFRIAHEGEALVFTNAVPGQRVDLAVGNSEDTVSRLVSRRQSALSKVIDVFGGPLQLLPPDDALETIKRVNALLADDPYRPADFKGNPGGLVNLPTSLSPVLVGDLHAQVDNLLKVLSENGLMEGLEREDAALILLGDVVHPASPPRLSFMDSSLLMMDLIFRLKLRFPRQVFFLIGNHDSFSPDVLKGGVPQGLLWDERVTSLRGTEYRMELARFYQQSPVVAMSDDFIACHAGPGREGVSLDTLINVRHFPSLLHDLTWTRVKTPAYPGGYTHADVKKFRRAVGLDDGIPFIVGHYPLSNDEVIWLNARSIRQHHIVHSARSNHVGVFSRVRGHMVPHVYAAEPLLDWINDRARRPPPQACR